MSRLDGEQWAAIRREWEDNEICTFADLAKTHSIDRTNISRRAAKEGWQKTLRLSAINQAAQRKADARVDSDGHERPYSRRKTDIAPINTEQAEDLRADVLARHRKEWSELEQFRQHALAKMNNAHLAGDFDLWKIAKAAMDATLSAMRALAVKQGGETKAWGLDAEDDHAGFDAEAEKGLDAVYQEGLDKLTDMQVEGESQNGELNEET